MINNIPNMRRLLASCLFCLCLPLEALPVLTRGPYLQMPASTAVTVRWRTDTAAVGTVRFGTSAAALSQSVSGTAATTEHELRLTGLSPATRYHYTVEASGTVLSQAAEGFFTTPPAVGSNAPVRFWVLGDCGTADENAQAVRDAYANTIHNGPKPAQFIMMLGDNAYYGGSDEEFQASVFDTYPALLRQLPLWPTVGNHETYSTGGATGMPYLDIFTLPTQGQAGGVASGTELYYSFDHGNIHFVCLDSMESNRAPNGAMAQWLAADLQASLQPWTVAFFHHPPYSRGSHDSDWETELVEMRENLIPILEAHGVDLVLAGHSHSYERSRLLDGHYGTSETFLPSHFKSAASGNPNTTGPYLKAGAGATPRQGAVYVVAGSSGSAGGGSLDHPVMLVNLAELGSLIVDVEGPRMDVRFLRETGAVDDHFAIVKGVVPPASPANLVALGSGVGEVRLHWDDLSDNETGFVVSGSTDGVAFTPLAVVAANSFAHTVTGLTPSVTNYFRVAARNVAGDSSPANTASLAVPASAPGLSAVELWRFDHFGTTSSNGTTGDEADPDGDGQTNLMEHALGTLPNRSGSRPVPTSAVTLGGVLQFSFPRQALTDVTYVVETKSDLGQPAWTEVFTSTGVQNTAGTVTVDVPALPAFVRLRVTR